MRHAKKRHQLNRFSSWRKATLNSLARSILLYQSIKTTQAKAKAAQPLIEKLISWGRQNTLFARRQAYQLLNDHKLVHLLFTEIAPLFNNRASGFTRIIPFAQRRGDGASLVIFELTEKKIKAKKEKKPKKEKLAPPLQQEQQPPELKEKPKTSTAVLEKEKKEEKQKPAKGFLKGIRGIFKKERDAL
jgi:large subunit ribosomal protein L17